MSGQRHAEIAGGGFAGLVAATALAQRGWSVRVHERAGELRAFGAGIWIWSNGIRVLDAIGVREAVLEGAHYPPMWERRDGADKVIDSLELRGSGEGVVCLVRQHLHGTLRDAAEAAGVDLVTNSKAIHADPAGVLQLADGTRMTGDLVVAADGVHSKLRDSLGLLKRHRKHKEGAIRLIVPSPGPGEGALSLEDSVKVIEWWGDGRNLLYTPCGGGIVYLCLTARCSDSAARAIPVDKQAWGNSFPSLRPLFAQIDSQGRWDTFETLSLNRWSKGRVAVVGDAAHSMTPGLGQGAGMAMTERARRSPSQLRSPQIGRWRRRFSHGRICAATGHRAHATVVAYVAAPRMAPRARPLGLRAGADWLAVDTASTDAARRRHAGVSGELTARLAEEAMNSQRGREERS